MRSSASIGSLLASLLTLTFSPASAGASGALPRATADRPDDRIGPQIHALYVVPSDGQDRQLDTDGTVAASVSSFQGWLRGQTGGKALRADTFQGELDVSFVRLAQNDAAIASSGAFVRDLIERELRQRGFADPVKVDVVYYDGSSTYACGGGAWPPTLPGSVAAIYMRATYGAGALCYDPTQSRAGLQLMDLAVLHETLHTLGFVPTCARHHTRAGHVSDSPTDLMYAGDEPWRPSVLDVGRDDYFAAGVPGCADLAGSPFLATGDLVRVTVAIVKRGGEAGTVTSSPLGIDCPPACSVDVERGTRLTLTAAPDPLARFEGWRGACTGTEPCTLSVEAPKSVEAVFGPAFHTLTVSVTGSGRVRSMPAGLDCSRRCTAEFSAGTAVRLRAVPRRGWRFHAWTGACTGRRACVVRMDASLSVRARFRRR